VTRNPAVGLIARPLDAFQQTTQTLPAGLWLYSAGAIPQYATACAGTERNAAEIMQ
jgi:hypothetical protein